MAGVWLRHAFPPSASRRYRSNETPRFATRAHAATMCWYYSDGISGRWTNAFFNANFHDPNARNTEPDQCCKSITSTHSSLRCPSNEKANTHNISEASATILFELYNEQTKIPLTQVVCQHDRKFLLLDFLIRWKTTNPKLCSQSTLTDLFVDLTSSSSKTQEYNRMMHTIGCNHIIFNV